MKTVTYFTKSCDLDAFCIYGVLTAVSTYAFPIIFSYLAIYIAPFLYIGRAK